MDDQFRGSSESFPAPHPEGQVHDPDGYAALIAERTHANLVFFALTAIVVSSLGVSFMPGMESFGRIAGLFLAAIMSATVAAYIVTAYLWASKYRTRLSEHQLRVAALKEAVAREQVAVARDAQQTAIETKELLSTQLRGSTVVNNVTLNFSNGSNFSGPLVVGENISVSYSVVQNAKDVQMRTALEDLIKISTPLLERIVNPDEKQRASEQLRTIAEQASSSKPNKWLIDVSGSGLVEAAKAFADIAAPVTTAVKAVLALAAGAA